jgi:hypothetical protein
MRTMPVVGPRERELLRDAISRIPQSKWSPREHTEIVDMTVENLCTIFHHTRGFAFPPGKATQPEPQLVMALRELANKLIAEGSRKPNAYLVTAVMTLVWGSVGVGRYTASLSG